MRKSGSSSSEKYEKYLNFSCTGLCIACNANTSEVVPQMTGLCSKRTYNGIDACRKICMEKRMADADTKGLPGAVTEMMGDCEDCLGNSKCQGIEPDLCKAIDNERDMIEVFMNASAKKIGDQKVLTINCPVRSKLDSDGKKCVCDPGYEFDSLHTVCLNKQAAVNNIETLLSFLPDDILDGIKKKAQEQINQSVDKNAPFLSDKAKSLKFIGGLVSSKLISDEALAQLIYTNLIYNTDNLRQLIKYLGKNKTEKLIEILETILSEQPEKRIETPQSNKQSADEERWRKYEEIRDKQNQLEEEKWQACPVHNSECVPGCNYDLLDEDCYKKCYADKGCFVCNKDSDCEGVFDSVGFKARCNTKLSTQHSCEAIIPGNRIISFMANIETDKKEKKRETIGIESSPQSPVKKRFYSLLG